MRLLAAAMIRGMRRGRGAAGRFRMSRWLVALGLVGGWGGLAGGCASGMSAIDARTRALLEERTRIVGADLAPQRVEPRVGPIARDAVSATVPATVNPPASDLAFDQLAADRNVAERLQAFTDEALGVDAPDRLELGLDDALRLAQERSREYRSAEEDYILSAIRLLIERHLWSPRFFNDTSATLSGFGSDGAFETALDIVNTLRVTKRLPFGGQAEARWVWQAAQDLRSRVSEEYVQSSRLVLSGNIPLLRGAGLVARESLIQRERDLVYAARDFERFRRELVVQIANDYFNLLRTQARVASQREQIRSQQQSLARTEALVEAGELRPFQRAIAENGLRNAESNLASLNQQYVLQIERFLVRLGLDPRTPVTIPPLDLELPEPDVTQDEAAQAALTYRLDLQNRRDRLDDQRRAVLNARNELLADLDLDGSLTLPTDSDRDVGGLAFDGGDIDFSIGATLSLPLDREQERLALRQSMIALERAQREYERFRDSVIIDARSSLRGIELARFRLQLAERQVELAERRLEEQQLDPAGVTAQEFLDTTNDLLNARNSRDDAMNDLRSAILDYFLQTGQLRVSQDGTLRVLGQDDGAEGVEAGSTDAG